MICQLGLVFSIVLKSDVNSHVSLVDTDIDDLLTWKNVTVNIEGMYPIDLSYMHGVPLLFNNALYSFF